MPKFTALALGWHEPLTVHRINLQWIRCTDDILPIGDINSKGDLMPIDIYAKSVQLLERVANSVHDRDPKNPNLLTFSVSEIHIVEDWIKELLKELKE
jgi:hypothetical protein